MIIGIIGLGHIGGSLAWSLKENGFAERVIGFDKNLGHAERAAALGLVHETTADFGEICRRADLVLLAVPVDVAVVLLPEILGQLAENQFVMDVGSTKSAICEAVEKHPRRTQFLAAHPMSGTEYSGPDSAVLYQFDGKVMVFCEAEKSAQALVELAARLSKSLRMRVVQMDAAAHDRHVAYVSHISHVASFALARTVLEKEKDEKSIFDLASSGFASTVRLAKSNPEMWLPIFKQNRENVLDVLDEYLISVKKMRDALAEGDFEMFHQMMREANQIGRILK